MMTTTATDTAILSTERSPTVSPFRRPDPLAGQDEVVIDAGKMLGGSAVRLLSHKLGHCRLVRSPKIPEKMPYGSYVP